MTVDRPARHRHRPAWCGRRRCPATPPARCATSTWPATASRTCSPGWSTTWAPRPRIRYAAVHRLLPRRPASRPAVGHPAAVPGAGRRAGGDRSTGSPATRFVTALPYHHGYYDGVEREFRGFGMVEQIDGESFVDHVLGVEAVDGNQDTSPELFQPPVTTKTWYHTGAPCRPVRRVVRRPAPAHRGAAGRSLRHRAAREPGGRCAACRFGRRCTRTTAAPRRSTRTGWSSRRTRCSGWTRGCSSPSSGRRSASPTSGSRTSPGSATGSTWSSARTAPSSRPPRWSTAAPHPIRSCPPR